MAARKLPQKRRTVTRQPVMLKKVESNPRLTAEYTERYQRFCDKNNRLPQVKEAQKLIRQTLAWGKEQGIR